MNKNSLMAQEVFLGKLNRICKKFGLNSVMAQLYAILYFSDKTLSLDDMANRLEISKGSASVNIRGLERYGAVRRVWVKGSRRDYYEAETNIVKVISDIVGKKLEGRLLEIGEMIRDSSEVLNSFSSSNNEQKNDIGVFKERLEKVGELQYIVQALFGLLNGGMLSDILSNKVIRGSSLNDGSETGRKELLINSARL